MHYRTIAITAGRRFLAQAIAQARLRNESRLPAIAALARQAGVSRMSMWKAVRELAREDTLSVKKGAGISIVGAVRSAGDREIRHAVPTAWQRTRNAIAADIQTGDFRHSGILPSAKELADRYGVDLRTLRKSLRALVGEKIIERRRARHHVNRHPSSAGSSVLHLIVPAGLMPQLQWSYYDAKAMGFFTRLERECRRHGIRLCTRGYPDALRHAGELRESIGCILWVDIVAGHVAELKSFLSSLPFIDKPLAIVDIGGYEPYAEPHANAARCAVFAVDDFSGGMEMGRYLIELGHRRIAFFTRSQEWSLARLEGVREAFTKAVISREVKVFRPSVDDCARAAAAHDGLSIMRRELAAIREHAPVISMLDEKIGEAGSFVLTAREIGPCLNAALADPAITAWVCESDSMAIYAVLPFLHEQRIAVPQRLSLAGFEDTTAAFINGLTTTDQKVDRYLGAIMEHLLYAKGRRSAKPQRSAVQAQVVVRATSGPPRGHT